MAERLCPRPRARRFKTFYRARPQSDLLKPPLEKRLRTKSRPGRSRQQAQARREKKQKSRPIVITPYCQSHSDRKIHLLIVEHIAAASGQLPQVGVDQDGRVDL